MTVSDDERHARATLTYIAEPGDRLLGRMVRRLGPIKTLDAVRDGHPPPELIANGKERTRLAKRLERWRVRLPSAAPEADLTLCSRLGGRLVCPGDAEWPTQLDALEDTAPYGLWLRGPADLRYSCLRSISMVGARAATSYGVRVAADMAAELSDRGYAVVSGGALGIDGAAHRGTLAAGGTTIAVLANGVDIAYPRRNDGLLAEIADNALLVSEWPPGIGPTRLRFLIRNRVIAALTRGTVVVEADLRSGALNTARFAQELNRPVMAVPGPVNSVVSRGCHKWLRDGTATCVSTAAEVMDTVGRIGEDLAPEPRGPILPRDRLEPLTRLVLEAVPAQGSAGPAQIAVRAGVDIVTARSRLELLSAAGFIERRGQGWRFPTTRKGVQNRST